MREIPQSLVETYGFSSERPWWRYDGLVVMAGKYVRRDGSILYVDMGDDPKKAKEEFDRKNPLEKPPIRVGQIWWFESSGVITITGYRDDSWGISGMGISTDLPDFQFGARTDHGVLLYDPFEPELAPWAGTEKPVSQSVNAKE